MNKLIKVIASTGVLTLAKMAMGFVIAKVVAVYTGPSGMALLGQVQSAVSALNGIMSSSVGNGIVRYTSEHNNKGYGHCSLWWRASLQWALILYGIIMPILVYYSEDVAIWLFYDKSYAWLVSLCAFTLPLSTLGTLFTSIINGYKNFKRFVILGMISVIISSACMILFIINYNLKGALIAAVMQSVLIGFIMIVFNIRQPWFKLRFFLGKTTAESRKQVGSYIIIALVSAVMAPVTLIIVRNILIGTVGWEQTGEWQAVWKISEVYLGVITIALSTYYLPQLSSLPDTEAIIKEIHKTALVVIPLAIIMAAAVYICRDLIITILFTKEFSGARELFLIQLIGDVIKIASWLYAFPMLSRGATKWFVCSEVFFSVSFVLFVFLFVPMYGSHGANYAYALNYLLYFTFCITCVRRFSN